MNLVSVFFGVVFAAAGVLFASGRLLPHLSAWKRMPPEEKEKIDILPLCRNIGEMILLSGIIFLFNGLIPAFRKHWFTGAMIAWLIVAGLDLWFINKSGRFRKDSKTPARIRSGKGGRGGSARKR